MRVASLARPMALVALVLAMAASALAIVDRGSRYSVTAEFENASQLVGGELVTVGGVAAGSVESIELGDDGAALVGFTVDQEFAPLPVGTTAEIHSQSLSGVANRRVELSLPPAAGSAATIPDGGTIGRAATRSEVDLDQILNTLDADAVRDLKRVIEGSRRSLAGAGGDANRGLRHLAPLLSTSRRVLGELAYDRVALGRLIVETSRLSGALASRAPELSRTVRRLSAALGAVGRERAALAAATAGLPAFLSQADTTFVDLRAAADDLEPLLAALRPLAPRLGPFFGELRAAARDAVPTLRDLDALVGADADGRDLVGLLALGPALARAGIGTGSPDCGARTGRDHGAAADGDFGQGALGEARCALRNSLPVIAHLRAYSPELVGWFDDFSTTGTIDANGGIGRIAGTFNAFTANVDNGLPELLSPIDPADLFGVDGSGPLIDVGNLARCPGSNERDPGDGSVPFTDGGALACDPTQVPVGP